MCSMDPHFKFKKSEVVSQQTLVATLQDKSLFKKRFLSRQSSVEPSSFHGFPHCEIKMMSAQYTR